MPPSTVSPARPRPGAWFARRITCLRRCIPGDPWHAVEVGIGAGQIRKAVGTQDGDGQRVIVQEASLLAYLSCRIQQVGANGQNANVEKCNFLNGLTEALQGLHLGRMVPKPQGDPARLPAEGLHRLDRHESMRDLADDVRARNPVDYLVFDTFEELGDGQTEEGVWLKMVDEHAGIHEDARPGGQLDIDHALSCGSSSGLRATTSASSWLPVQPMRPEVRRTRLVAACTVIWTFSCS